MKIKTFKFKTLVVLILLLTLALVGWRINSVRASMTALSDVMTRLKQGELSSHDITFTLDGTIAFDTGEDITIDFKEDAPDNAFAVAGATSVIGDFDFNDGAERTIIHVQVGSPDCTGTSGNDDIAVGIDDTTGVVTFEACGTYAPQAAGSTVNIEYGEAAAGPGTNRVTNPSVANTYVLDIAGSVGDTGKIAVVILVEDQISVTASVDPSITYTLGVGTLALGVLDDSTISAAGPNTMIITTNATGGYVITVQDIGNGSNPGLWNSAASHLIASADAAPLVVASEGYGGQCERTGGAEGACDATFPLPATDNVGGFLLAADTFASYGSKPTIPASYTISVKATVAGTTDAGSYADTLTFIATATF